MKPLLINDIVRTQDTYDFACQIISDHKFDNLDDCPTDWSIGQEEGIQYFGWLFMSNVRGLRRRNLEDCHRSWLSIHRGGNKMYQDLKRMYWWPNMQKDIVEFIGMCAIYQWVKAKYHQPSSLYQTLSIPKWKLAYLGIREVTRVFS